MILISITKIINALVTRQFSNNPEEDRDLLISLMDFFNALTILFENQYSEGKKIDDLDTEKNGY